MELVLFNICLLVTSLFGIQQVAAETADDLTQIEAWQWPTEKRLSVRFDSNEIEYRSRMLSEDVRDFAKDGVKGYVIDGRMNPELFLPWELFNELISRGYSHDLDARGLFRDDIERNLSSVALPEVFWPRLEQAAHEFIDSRLRQFSLAQRFSRATPTEAADFHSRIQQVQDQDCRRRYQALRAAELEFGREFFLRFLYEGVAPGTVLSSPSSHNRSSELLYVQEGCR